VVGWLGNIGAENGQWPLPDNLVAVFVADALCVSFVAKVTEIFLIGLTVFKKPVPALAPGWLRELAYGVEKARKTGTFGC
jgi:hypothetical protein